MTLQDFKNKHLGKQVEYHSFGGGAYNQCVDLVNAYINQVLDVSTKDYTEIIGANAKDFVTKYDPDDFNWVANTPTGVPQPGDIIVWNGKVGGGVGHVAIFLEGDANSFKSLDQNWSQVERVTQETHKYTNVTGWLHPKEGVKTITIEQELFEKLVMEGSEYQKLVSAGYPHVEDVLNIVKEKENIISGNTKDINQCEAQVGKLLDDMQKLNDEDKHTSEQLLDAQHKLQPYIDEALKVRRALNLMDEVDTQSLLKAIEVFKSSKVKTPKIQDMTFLEKLRILFG